MLREMGRVARAAAALLVAAMCLGMLPSATGIRDDDAGRSYGWSWAEGAGGRVADVRTEDFTESGRELENPDRGLYCVRRYVITDERKGRGYYRADVGWLRAGQEKYGNYTLGLAEVDLADYRDRELSQGALDEIDAMLSAWAEYGYGLVLRFCYGVQGWSGIEGSLEPDDINMVIRHMEQLGPVLKKHAGTVFTLQGLFTGAWGEGHTTRFGSEADIRRLAGTLASVTDPGTYLAVRTPAQWRTATGDGSDTALARRMGLFNDGMLGNESDLGTYLESGYPLEDGGGRRYRDDELTFQEELCAATPNGGQVAGVDETDGGTVANGLYNGFEDAVRDLSRMHVTYIDQDWRREVLEGWERVELSEEWGCFAGKTGLDYIRCHLGYRLLISGLDVSSGASRDQIAVSIGFRNAGFAPMYKEPEVKLLLVDGRDRIVRSCTVDHDLTALSGGTSAGDVGTVRATVPLKGLADGAYRLFVDLGVEGAGGECVPILLANEQDRERDRGYLVGTVTLSTYIKN